MLNIKQQHRLTSQTWIRILCVTILTKKSSVTLAFLQLLFCSHCTLRSGWHFSVYWGSVSQSSSIFLRVWLRVSVLVSAPPSALCSPHLISRVTHRVTIVTCHAILASPVSCLHNLLIASRVFCRVAVITDANDCNSDKGQHETLLTSSRKNNESTTRSRIRCWALASAVCRDLIN